MKNREAKNVPGDVEALALEFMREVYLQEAEYLRSVLGEMDKFNQNQKAIREYVQALREFQAKCTAALRQRYADLCRSDKEDLAIPANLLDQHAHPYEVGEVERGLCIPDRVPPAGVSTVDLLDAAIEGWEEKLGTIGDDAQIANIDLQKVLERQQQILQLLSNISKLLENVACSIVRRMGE